MVFQVSPLSICMYWKTCLTTWSECLSPASVNCTVTMKKASPRARERHPQTRWWAQPSFLHCKLHANVSNRKKLGKQKLHTETINCCLKQQLSAAATATVVTFMSKEHTYITEPTPTGKEDHCASTSPEICEEPSRPLVSHQLRYVALRPRPVLVPQVLQLEGEVDVVDVLDRDHEDARAQVGRAEGARRPDRLGDVLVLTGKRDLALVKRI